MGQVKGTKRVRGESWQLRVSLGRDPVTGKARYRTETYKGSSRDADRRLGEMVKDAGRDGSPATMTTYAELLDRWWEAARENLSPSTVRAQTHIISCYIKPNIGNVPLAKLDTATIDRFYRRLRKEGGAAGRALSPSSVHRVRDVVRKSLGQAVKWGWIQTNPALGATPPSAIAPDLRPPEPVEVTRIIHAARETNPALAVALRLAAATGMRRGEVVALRWSAIDLDRAVLTVRRGIVEDDEGNLVEKSTKTHAVRRLALDVGTVDILREHRTSVEKVAAELGVKLARDSFVFSHDPTGRECWRPDYVTHAFIVLTKRLGIEGVRLHDLRHYVATTLLTKGIDVRTVAGRLGHRSASMTLNVYAAFMPVADQQAADVMGSAFE